MNYGMTDLVSLLGALGLFLYGMKVMSDALLELAGDKMRHILATTTSNRFLAVLTGFSITAIIQSSSATSLMVVSFTNAGLLTLFEAIGVIMGANIGTTVTAWLVSILGFKISMSAIALPLIGFGFLLTVAFNKRYQYWGYFVIGFALLFIGLQFLKESLPDIGSNPEALAFLSTYAQHGFLSVLLFLVIGTLLTLLVQSSSATMVLTLLMCHEGWIPFDMAMAMVLGQNVGTTITANLAALVANYQAKRAARAHLIFNLVGVIWGVVFFYPLLYATEWLVIQIEGVSPLLSLAAIPIALSLFHTIFNLLNTLALLGFIEPIIRIVKRMVPVPATHIVEIDAPLFLDDSSLQFPETAIKAMQNESLRLLESSAYQAIAHGLQVHRSDLESRKKLKKILGLSTHIPVDIDCFYETKIKKIYSALLEYATQLQSQSSLEANKIEQVRNILIANRMLVRVIKKMKPLHKNIEHYLNLDNLTIRREYNILRRRILKVVRIIHHLSDKEDLSQQLQTLMEQRKKAEQLDVLTEDRVEKLLLTGDIDSDMASSLLNDSFEALHIAQMLVDIAYILYKPKDAASAHVEAQTQIDIRKVPEEERQELQALEEEALTIPLDKVSS